jgi:hypothetical protein
MDDTSATIGGLLARMQHVENELQALKKGQDKVLKILNQAQGGWRVVIYVGSAVAAIISILAAVFKNLWER